MKISIRVWIIFIVIAIIALCLWYKLSYPQFLFVDSKINRPQALQIAKQYLSEKGVDASSYLKSIIFLDDQWADRYLQRTLGFNKQEQFIRQHGYELFSWAVRFFRENQKEEYVIEISSRTGEIIGVEHLIKDTESRQAKDNNTARNIAKEFLKNKFNINFNEYDFHEENARKFDNRTDYEFSWEKKGVYIPWEKTADSGGAKLLVKATVSGDEVKDFYKSNLDIPEKFRRFIHNQISLGSYIYTIVNLIFFGWVAWGIFIIIIRKKELILQKAYRSFIALGVLILILGIIYGLNNLQRMTFAYPTSSFLAPFIGLNFINMILSYVFLTTAVIATGLAGESLRYEVLPKNKFSSFFHYINSTLCTRSVSRLILLGYLAFLILIGLQSAIFHLGQRFLGVWVENIRFSQLTSSYFPYLSAIIIGLTASFSEEIVYRMFGISWGKKYLKNIFLAVIFSCVIWGFSHSQYAIFPFWFRGVEVSILGIFFAFIFLRYGIIPAIVAHFLFDVFWGVAAYLLGNTTLNLFLSSLFIMIIPLILAIVCFCLNREEKEKKLEATLSVDQKYNLGILLVFVSEKKKSGTPANIIRQELVSYGWDQILVELAVKKVYSTS